MLVVGSPGIPTVLKGKVSQQKYYSSSPVGYCFPQQSVIVLAGGEVSLTTLLQHGGFPSQVVTTLYLSAPEKCYSCAQLPWGVTIGLQQGRVSPA